MEGITTPDKGIARGGAREAFNGKETTLGHRGRKKTGGDESFDCPNWNSGF